MLSIKVLGGNQLTTFFPRSSLLNAFFEGLETHMAFHMAHDHGFCERKRLTCVSGIVRYSSEYGISLGRLSFCSKSSSISFLGIRHPGPAKDIILAVKAPAISCDLWSSKQKHNKVPEHSTYLISFQRKFS